MRKIYFRNLRKFNTAQAMVEFLIVLPVMLLLVMGILQFSFIYQAKITLNYAAFQTARAGSLNNASMSAMEKAFTSNMAPLYTSSYISMNSSGDCESSFTIGGRSGRLSGAKIMQDGTSTRGVLEANINNFNSENVLCARRIVQQQLDDGYVNIQLINPTPEAFANYGIDGADGREIPNDNLMYRDSTVTGLQSIQDANLLKIHIGYCYELIVPFVDRIIWSFHALSTGTDVESAREGDDNTRGAGYFGTPATDFARSCINNPADAGRYSVVLNAQGIMRMQSAAILE